MNTEIKNLLTEELKRKFSNLKTLDPGSAELSYEISDLEKLYKLYIEDVKTEAECFDKTEQRKASVKDRCIKLGVDLAGIVIPTGFYAFWMKRGLKFEETGTFTSTTFKGLINRFRPTK